MAERWLLKFDNYSNSFVRRQKVSIFLVPTVIQYSKTENFCIFEINNSQTFIAQILMDLGPLEEKSSFLISLGFEA